VQSLDYYVTDLQNSIDNFNQAVNTNPTNRVLYEQGVFNFTNSLGMFSPILR
jgi:hypothetical protein